jgi:hypothetical protein
VSIESCTAAEEEGVDEAVVVVVLDVTGARECRCLGRAMCLSREAVTVVVVVADVVTVVAPEPPQPSIATGNTIVTALSQPFRDQRMVSLNATRPGSAQARESSGKTRDT